MAQLERKIRVSENSPKASKSQTSPTFEQLLKVEETYRSSNTSPTFRICHDGGEEALSPTHQNKKSVLTKVKERAKKLKYSLSGKRRFENEPSTHHTTPPWETTFDHYSVSDHDDDHEKDPDPEYLGAPMYESEAAPEPLKETARQHPRAVPVVAEKHRVPNRMSQEAAPENEKPLSPNATMSEAVSETLGPAYNAMSDATHKIASKIAGLAVTSQETQEQEQEKESFHRNASQIAVQPSSESKKMSENGGHLSPQTWDKGVSIKEYFMTKLEPGEDERALSQAITEAISPTKANTNKDTGVVEKMKEAVSSLFRQEEITNSMTNSASLSSSSRVPTISQHRQIKSTNDHSSKAHHPHSANSSPIIPLSSNAYEVHEEENHGKILQAN